MKDQREAFLNIDEDNDGFITKNELKRGFERLGGKVIDSDEANKIIRVNEKTSTG